MSETAKWYVVHTYSGYENKVASTLEQLISNGSMKDKIEQVLIPLEHVEEVNEQGVVKEYDRKVFPSYVLVKMIVDEASWYIVRNTNGVTGFVGTNPTKPTPLSDEEVAALGIDKSTLSLAYKVGDLVEIIKDENFEGFMGEVKSIDLDNKRVKVAISMFGDITTVELDIKNVALADDV